MTQTLTKWAARRSGATVTVVGYDQETERVVRITGVEEIFVATGENGERAVCASRKNGPVVRLSLS